ncbi:hypothetical protein [Photobacterium halotolerans]|uniref:hypothetical protein n=1 Tax=Photobacterium halotolerans TaxID=265726 RepID=UPI00040AE7D8|nr:hypothetical protein [Photobacterium halotolerans]
MKRAWLFITLWVCPLISLAQAQPDDERLLRALEEQGIICKGLSYTEKQEALRIYLHRKATMKDKKQKGNDTTKQPDTLDDTKKTCISPE